MAGSIEVNAALYKKKTYTYVPPAPPAVLIESTSYTLDFAARKFVSIGIDPTKKFQTVIQLLTSSRYVQFTPEFLKKIFSYMGHILSFILDSPQKYKRIIFCEDDLYKLSSMVYSGENVLVIEGKSQVGCRILLNRADLIQLQNLEWCISGSIGEKNAVIKPKVVTLIFEYCDCIIQKCHQADSPPKNEKEMNIFINSAEVRQMNDNHYLNQIKMFASAQVLESCMTLWTTRYMGVPYDENSKIHSILSPSYSPVDDDDSTDISFKQSDNLAMTIDENDGPTAKVENDVPQSPEEIPQSCDVNDGPDFFNRSCSPSVTPPPDYAEHPAPSHKRSHSTFTKHPTPVRNVKPRLF